METKLLKPASALSNIRKHIVTAAWAFDKREYHPYDMNNPDFIKTQKKLQYNDRMLKTLEVPFEELPNFLKPTINFEAKQNEPLITWIDKSVDCKNVQGKASNLFSGRPFDRTTAMKAVK